MAINVKEKARKILVAVITYGGWYCPDAWVVENITDIKKDSRDQVRIAVYEINIPVSLTKKLEQKPNWGFDLGSIEGIPLEISNITDGLNVSVACSHHWVNSQEWWFDKELPAIPYKKIAVI